MEIAGRQTNVSTLLGVVEHMDVLVGEAPVLLEQESVKTLNEVWFWLSEVPHTHGPEGKEAGLARSQRERDAVTTG